MVFHPLHAPALNHTEVTDVKHLTLAFRILVRMMVSATLTILSLLTMNVSVSMAILDQTVKLYYRHVNCYSHVRMEVPAVIKIQDTIVAVHYPLVV